MFKEQQAMKDKTWKKINGLIIIDARCDLAGKFDDSVGKKHDATGAPAMYFIAEGKDLMEYDGGRTSNNMAKYIREEIGGMSGKKRKTVTKRKPKRHTKKNQT